MSNFYTVSKFGQPIQLE